MNFSQRLRDLRNEKGITQQQIADKLNVPRTTYSGWERNAQEPNFNTLIKLANIFNVSTDYLLGRTKVKTYTLDESEMSEEAKMHNPSEEKCPYSNYEDFPKIVCAEEAARFIADNIDMMAMGGFDVSKLSNKEKISFANELLDQATLLGYKYDPDK